MTAPYYLFVSRAWHLLSLNPAHSVIDNFVPAALLFNPGCLVLEPEPGHRGSSPEAVEVAARGLDVTKAARLLVIVKAELAAKAGDNGRRPGRSFS